MKFHSYFYFEHQLIQVTRAHYSNDPQIEQMSIELNSKFYPFSSCPPCLACLSNTLKSPQIHFLQTSSKERLIISKLLIIFFLRTNTTHHFFLSLSINLIAVSGDQLSIILIFSIQSKAFEATR